jgi:hypothetical protein
MFRQKFSTPISIMFVALFVILMAMASAYTSARAIPSQQTDYDLTDTADEKTLDAEDTRDASTDTAGTQSPTANSSGQTSTPTTTGTPGTATPATGTPGTATPTRTATITPVRSTASAPVTPTQPLSQPTTAPLLDLPTETPIVVPADALTCFPGDPITITGDGPPHAAYLLYFGQRVVSGGSVSSAGRFSVSLVVGRERAGIYSVTVRVRGSPQVLRELTCAVPDVTPTPLPPVRALP